MGQRKLGQPGVEAPVIIQHIGREARSAAPLHRIALIAQPARHHPVGGEAIVQLGENPGAALFVLIDGRAAQVQRLVGLRRGQEKPRQTAEGRHLVAKGQPGLVRDDVLIVFGAARGHRLGDPRGLHIGHAQAVDDLHAIAEILAQIQHGGIAAQIPARVAGDGACQILIGRHRRFPGRTAGVDMGETQLRLETGKPRRLPQKLETQRSGVEILIGAPQHKARVGIGNIGVAGRVIHRKPRRQIGRDRPRDHRRDAAAVVAAILQLHRALAGEARVFRGDDHRPGDAVGALGHRLRAAEHLDAVHVPDRRGTPDQLVIGQVMAVDADRHARHGAAEKRGGARVRPLAVLTADRRRPALTARGGSGHVRHPLRGLGKAVLAGLVCLGHGGGVERAHRRGGALQAAGQFFARDDDRAQRKAVLGGLFGEPGLRAENTQGRNARAAQKARSFQSFHAAFLEMATAGVKRLASDGTARPQVCGRAVTFTRSGRSEKRFLTKILSLLQFGRDRPVRPPDPAPVAGQGQATLDGHGYLSILLGN